MESKTFEKAFKQTTGLKDFSLLLTGKANTQEIPLVQAFNIIFSDTKTPIWDFATKKFKQVALGKRLVEGTIILKESQIGMITTTKTDLETAEKIEKKLAKYSKTILPYITEKVNAYFNSIETSENDATVSGDNIMKSALRLLNDVKYEISLVPTSETVNSAGYKLIDVNFSEIQDTLKLDGAGVVVMKFFASWEEI